MSIKPCRYRKIAYKKYDESTPKTISIFHICLNNNLAKTMFRDTGDKDNPEDYKITVIDDINFCNICNFREENEKKLNKNVQNNGNT